MGNETSQFSNLEFEEKAVQVTDFWIHRSATSSCGSTVSVFVGESLINGSLWSAQTPLEKSTKHLKLYRHPCILKYISSWPKGSMFYLVSEDVKPLSLVLSAQNTMQICVGLHSVLKALCFLHDNASVSHNNICISSIYVTRDGDWHLGGMEYLCKFSELTEGYLSKTRRYRYDKAIDASESKYGKQLRENPSAIDSYAFGILVKEVLLNRSDEDLLWLASFRESVAQLEGPILSRPKILTLLDHKFFVHDFITVHSMLTELPLKADDEKMNFFSSLLTKLKTFDEVIVASQLGGLLLSRMVLLDKTAQHHMLPYLLCPRQELENESGLFSMENFKQYIIPKLLQIFCVRDVQIRLLLLEHFHNYMNCFSKEELQFQILPELLVGIKDTNDQLVAMTLRVLADIVPILGAVAVIGGRRAKLFSDGKPIPHTTEKYIQRSKRDFRKTQTFEPDHRANLELPERPSPDGEENESSNVQSTEDDLDNWDDWDATTEPNSTVNEVESISHEEPNLHIGQEQPSIKKSDIPDVLHLDIKSRSSFSKQDDIDYFQDMEPVIETSKPYYILTSDENDDKKLNLGIAQIEQHEEEGWGTEWD
ncbi:hypothetical protein PPYR_04677 [Photinus pyralis]|uniref:Protein kinase domain-containing protein n=1 Tax=Photinus pyralis TaxID=7054 RepID=A0A1Y1MEU6_PHOPY|nr:protein-associating with the carboxyl-terminal domain of ezrin [Photinus pyralis]KAB0802491.1 hypothetical protein PPYR_04677 [Photinus pyralis]